jgi:serralysin
MPWTSWSQVASPLPADANAAIIVDNNRVTYNYELPYYPFINFSFDTTQASGTAGTTVEFNDLQKQCVRNMLSYVHDVTGINFNEVANGDSQNMDLVYVFGDNAGSNPNGQTSRSWDFTEYPVVTYNAAGQITELDVKDTIVLSSNYAPVQNTQVGAEGYQALLRSTASALGLVANANLPDSLNSDNQTLMAANFSGNNYSAYRPLDIAALNWLYGGDGLQGRYGLTVNAAGVPIAAGAQPTSGGAAANTGLFLVQTS